MIECTEENIYYETFRVKNRKRRKVKRFLIFTVIILCVGVVFYHVNGAVFTLVSGICEDYAYSASLSSINEAVITSLNQELKYSDLIKIEKNNDGDISLMSADALKINSISRTVAGKTEEILKKKLSNGIPVPLFAFTGIKLASGFGPIVDYYAITVVGANCGFDSKFASVGINQTLHSLYIKVDCKVDIEFLYKKRSFDCASEVLVSEAVLVGKVPETYLKGALFR